MALPTGLKTAGGKAVAVVILVFMALLSFRGISTPSLSAQGEQRRPSFFNIRRDIPGVDSGLNELDVLNYWRSHAVSNDKILAYIAVDPKNHTHVQQAIQLFGGVYLGFQVPHNCLDEFNARKPWTPGPLTNDGHAVFAYGYDQSFVNVLTWGNTQPGTWAWWDECVDEAYAILPPEAANPGFAPGFNVTQLKQDLEAVAH